MEGGDKFNNDFWGDFSSKKENGRNGETFFINPGTVAKKQIITAARKEKLFSVLVGIGCLVAIVGGIYFMNESISGPAALVMSVAKNSAAANPTAETEQELNRVLELKGKDTDVDGLSDYDELYVYKTSPYLEDTDGDGVTDKKEIDQKTNPNCPGNQNCASTAAASDGGIVTGVSSSDVLSQASVSQQIMSGNADAATVRELLIQGGYPKATLDSMTDDEILQMYRDAISTSAASASTGISSAGGATGVANTGGGTSASTGQSAASAQAGLSALGVKSVDDLKNLSGAQIRTLLLQQGAPADQLSQISDEELKSVFIEKLNTAINKQQQ